MRLPWLRLHHEARNDAKLETLSDAEHRVWFRLLCFSGEQEERGIIAGYDDELLAIEVARGDVAVLRATLERLQKLRIISMDEESVRFLNFMKRQYDKASDRPEATRDRKRKERDNKKSDDAVTPMSRAVTPVTHRGEERREEKKREESTSLTVGVGVERARDQKEPDRSAPPPAPLEAVPKNKSINADSTPLLERIEQAAGDLRGKSLTRSERKTVNGWFERNKHGLTEQIIDEAEHQTAEHTSDGSMAYFFRVMERMAQEPGAKKPGSTKGNSNGKSNGHRTSSEKQADTIDATVRRWAAISGGVDGLQEPGSERLPAPGG